MIFECRPGTLLSTCRPFPLPLAVQVELQSFTIRIIHLQPSLFFPSITRAAFTAPYLLINSCSVSGIIRPFSRSAETEMEDAVHCPTNAFSSPPASTIMSMALLLFCSSPSNFAKSSGKASILLGFFWSRLKNMAALLRL